MRVARCETPSRGPAQNPGFVAEKQSEFHFSNGLACQRHWLARGYIYFLNGLARQRHWMARGYICYILRVSRIVNKTEEPSEPTT